MSSWPPENSWGITGGHGLLILDVQDTGKPHHKLPSRWWLNLVSYYQRSARHDGTNDLHAHKQKEIGHDIMGIYHDYLICISFICHLVDPCRTWWNFWGWFISSKQWKSLLTGHGEYTQVYTISDDLGLPPLESKITPWKSLDSLGCPKWLHSLSWKFFGFRSCRDTRPDCRLSANDFKPFGTCGVTSWWTHHALLFYPNIPNIYIYYIHINACRTRGTHVLFVALRVSVRFFLSDGKLRGRLRAIASTWKLWRVYSHRKSTWPGEQPPLINFAGARCFLTSCNIWVCLKIRWNIMVIIMMIPPHPPRMVI